MKEPVVLADGSPTASAAAMLAHPTLAVAVVERGRVRHCNAAWRALFSLPGDVSVESHLISLFPNANSAGRFEEAVRSAVDADPASIRVEHMLVRRDGVPFMAEAIVHPATGRGAGPVGLATDAIWQVRDITAERELRRELRDLEAYYRALATYQWDLTFVVDKRDCITFASPSVETLLGWRTNALLGEPFASLLATSGAVGAMQWLRGARTDRAASLEGYRLRVRHQSGETRVLECRLRNCVDVPRITGLVINARDVTDDVEAEERDVASRKRGDALRERLFEVATALVGSFEERVGPVLRAACDALGASSAEYWTFDDGAGSLRFVHGYAARRATEGPSIDRSGTSVELERAPSYAGRLRARRPIVVDDVERHDAIDGAHRDLLLAAGVGASMDFPVAMDGAVVGVLSIAEAGHARDWRVEEIDFAAGMSLLIAASLEDGTRVGPTLASGATAAVADRSHGLTALADRVEKAGTTNRSLVVALLDVDGFKEINDAYGQAKGDALLVSIGRLLAGMGGDESVVARMGGDEFLFVSEEATVGHADVLLQGILDRLASETLVADVDQRIGASIGVARFPSDGEDAERLLSVAEGALAEAKSRGRQQVFAFGQRPSKTTDDERDLGLDLEAALGRDEFRIFFQPQISFATAEVIGMEALLRWQHPTRGLLLPETFLEAAIQRGMIDSVTKWVVVQVCEQIVSWRRAGTIVDVPVSVNVSGKQFHDRRLPAIVASALMKSALPARMLMLEVTAETLAANRDATERALRELSRLGARISIADFRFDDASLTWLRRIEGAQIKIERGVVQGLPRDDVASVLVDAVVALGRRLGRQVVAEGVETDEQVERLAAIGCDAGQGFHFGAPLSASELQDFIGTRQSKRAS